MSRFCRVGLAIAGTVAVSVGLVRVPHAQSGAGRPARTALFPSTMTNPYRMLGNWAQLGSIKPGGAIGIVPDGQGGAWLLQRSEPPILHLDASGHVVKTFGDGMFVQPHGMCRDLDGNFWAADSGPFQNESKPSGRGFVIHKFTPDGTLLLTLGKPGVSKAGPDTFIGPTSCAVAANGDIIIADGHIPRPSTSQRDGDRIVRVTKEGKFVRQWGKQGTNPGEFMGPHALAFDSQGRLFVADRSNNRLQIFDKDMNFVDDWRQFGRPSGLWITKDDTLFVADSESSYSGFRPTELNEVVQAKNAGWQFGVRVGSARDGSLRYFNPTTRPEGMAADELGNVFAGITGSGCERATEGCLQKWVKK